jgi:hypothetical protein
MKGNLPPGNPTLAAVLSAFMAGQVTLDELADVLEDIGDRRAPLMENIVPRLAGLTVISRPVRGCRGVAIALGIELRPEEVTDARVRRVVAALFREYQEPTPAQP